MKKLIGNKEFYKIVIALVLPIMIQQGITNFVNLLDNIMVGKLGTEPMTGVAVINQLIFVYNISLFGCLSGASIYGAQFHGNKDHDGVRYTFRFMIIAGTVVCGIALLILSTSGESLIKLYLKEDAQSVADIGKTLIHAKDYLKILIWGLFPFMLSQCYATTLRGTGETMLPMIGSTIALLVNLILNYILIFGHFGFEPMGVKGAAIATVISRYIEAFYIIVRTHKNSDKYIFIYKAFNSLHIPSHIIKKIVITGLPLLINELTWAIGMATITQSYAFRGIVVMAAYNISSIVSDLFKVIFFAMGNAISILVGQQLGAGDIEKAKDTDKKIIFFCVSMYVVIGGILMLLAPYIPYIYETEDVVRNLASKFLGTFALVLPIMAFNHCAYFTMRSGGRTIITFLFDSVFVWVISLPLAFTLSRFTNINIALLYFIIQFSECIKTVIGAILLKSGIWARNIISDREKL